ncbi:CoA transferase [Frankia gtarii]|uniref:CoA transferase n=1 Tax=Frankia gtarii TaxID=2950102 RepID=UPI0021BE746D|nr:CoA transferase [Frankia gtarii]
MPEPLLNGIRVVDLSTGVAGPTVTMLMAEAGADVVLVEPPGGHPDRALPGFRTWARSKQSLVLDVDSPEGRLRLDELLRGADVLVHSYGPTTAARLGLDDAAVGSRYPALVVSSVLAWPTNHVDADRPVDDLLALARLGLLDEQQGHRPGPVHVRFPLGSWGAMWLCATGIAARLVARGRTGRGGPVHTSLVQGALVPMMMHWHRAEAPSALLAAGMPKDEAVTPLFECADGEWIHVMPPSPDDLPLTKRVFDEMGADAVAEANRRHDPGIMARAFPNWGANVEAFRRRPAAEWLAELWSNDRPAQPVLPLGAVLDDEQAKANRYVTQLDDPEAGRITVPGHPVTLDPPASVRHPAPRLGEHQDVAARHWTPRSTATDRGRADADSDADSDAGGPVESLHFPLQGLRVLDFGAFLAGPFAPMLFADLGADVVKVEPVAGEPGRWGDWPFVGCQRGKRAVALDLKSEAARPAVEALLRWADVVHHNLRLPAARRLGLDEQAVRAVNPDVVFCHTSSYGPDGARANWPGYDQLFQSSLGWERMGGGEDNPPMWHRFGFMDHQCALSSAAATLWAVFARDRTGRASSVAASLLGAGVLTTSETYLRPDGTLAPVPMLDQAQLTTTPGRRLLACAEGWVAMAATGDSDVAAACQALGCGSAAELAAAAAARPAGEVLDLLAGAGVAAEEVRLDQRDAFFDSADNDAAGLIARYRHHDWGGFEQPGALWDLGDLTTQLHLAPPVLGEHTIEVLTEVGIARETIDELIAAGVATAAPPPILRA